MYVTSISPPFRCPKEYAISGPNDEALKERARQVMPAGVPGHMSGAMRSGQVPQFFERAEGSYLWDYDGNRYIDYMCAYGPNLLGYGHPEINQAFVNQLKRIDAGSGPSQVMVELAEAYCQQISHATWSMFSKNGTDSTSAAVMVCRAYQGKRKVLFSTGAYHGAAAWCTPVPNGTVPEDRSHFIMYEYNNAESLEAAVVAAGDDLAGIFVSPFKHDFGIDQEIPTPAFAQRARELCDASDALLVVDDVRAGFRIARDCSWSTVCVLPDLSCWGKDLANGHPISALMGNERAREAASKIFVTGSYWYGAAAMAAALKTLDVINESDYLEHTVAMGDRLRLGLGEIADEHGLNLSQTGPSQMPLILFNKDDGERDIELSTAFTDNLLGRGVYFHIEHNMFINAALSAADVDHTLEAAREALAAIKLPRA